MAFDFLAGYTDAAVGDGNVSNGLSALDRVDGETPETILGEAETARILAETLNGLTFAHQQVILLHVGEGLSFEEIGVQLGITKQAAHERYKRGVERMRASLAIMGIKERRVFAS
jgi:RNA polymerase sigma factor (sigma-70 family)